MPNDLPLQPRRPVPSEAERERTIALLSDRFAQGDLDIDTFEERVAIAHRAQNSEELAALCADLARATPKPSAEPAIQLASKPPTADEAVAIFGGVQRVGRWNVPRRLRVVAVFGGVELDLRNAELPAGVIEIDVRAVFGGVQIIVPPTLAVEVHGLAIFGGFEHMHQEPPTPDPNAPALKIRGKAVFGGVSVETRLEDESQGMAHRRRRKEVREQRHMRRLGK